MRTLEPPGWPPQCESLLPALGHTSGIAQKSDEKKMNVLPNHCLMASHYKLSSSLKHISSKEESASDKVCEPLSKLALALAVPRTLLLHLNDNFTASSADKHYQQPEDMSGEPLGKKSNSDNRSSNRNGSSTKRNCSNGTSSFNRSSTSSGGRRFLRTISEDWRWPFCLSIITLSRLSEDMQV